MPQGAGEGIIDGRTDQVDGSGVDEWLAGLNDDEVQFSLVKMTMGDRESKRPKFVLVTWIGPSVGVMKKAKVSIHKSSVKEFVGVRRSLPASRLRSPLTPAPRCARSKSTARSRRTTRSCSPLTRCGRRSSPRWVPTTTWAPTRAESKPTTCRSSRTSRRKPRRRTSRRRRRRPSAAWCLTRAR